MSDGHDRNRPLKVGLMCGREYSFPPAFIERVNELGAAHGITAEMVSLGGTRMDDPADTGSSWIASRTRSSITAAR